MRRQMALKVPHTYKYAHGLVANTAKELAAEAFDYLAKDNLWFARNPSQKDWIRNSWPMFRDEARKALVALLVHEGTREESKEIISDALIDDHQLTIEGATRQAAEGIG